MDRPRRFLGRRSRLKATITAAAVLGIIGANANLAAAAEHYYRNDIDIRTAPPSRYLIEVPESAAMHGGYLRVTVDDRGRVTRSVFLIDGKPASETVYQYSGDAKLPHRAENYKQGAMTGYEEITRDTAGQPTRINSYTAQGELTGYTTNTYTADHADGANYTPNGTRRSHWTEYFSPDGAEVRYVRNLEGSSASQEVTYDPLRGIAKSTKQFKNGELQISIAKTYDSDDDLIREDLYNPKGVWYGAKIYEHSLLTQKRYKFINGTSMEVDIAYDAKRWTTGSTERVDGKVVCKFQIEHLPDGTVSRTIAEGPDGSLWAEYPNLAVIEVGRDGHPPNSTAGILHKTGNWW